MSKIIEMDDARPSAALHATGAGRRVLASLLGANLASAAAAAMVNIFVAGYVKQLTGAALWAAAAIVVAYLPPLFIGSYLGGLIDRKLQRNGVMLAELLTVGLTVGCGLAVVNHAPLSAILLLLGLRSLLVAAVRNSLTRWLKLDAPAELQESRMQLFILTILLALPASGLAMGWAATVAGQVAVSITAIAVVLHMVSFGIMSRLPAKPPQLVKGKPDRPPVANDDGLISTLREIFSNPILATLFVTRIFAQPVFQAAEQILVSVKGASLGATGMAKMQIVGGLGLLAGFFLIRQIKPQSLGKGPVLGIIGIGLGCLLLAAHPETTAFSLPAFFGMTVIYEIIYVYSVSRFFKLAPPEAVARYSITSTHIGGTLMSVSAMLFALLIDHTGFGVGALAFIAGAIAYGLLLLAWLARSRRLQ